LTVSASSSSIVEGSTPLPLRWAWNALHALLVDLPAQLVLEGVAFRPDHRHEHAERGLRLRMGKLELERLFASRCGVERVEVDGVCGHVMLSVGVPPAPESRTGGT
jgi:hypothetical protein